MMSNEILMKENVLKSNEINNLIIQYAKVYQQFEDIQNGTDLPKGDQKTGVIGEYYAHCYYRNQPGVNEVNYAKSGEAFDLTLTLESGAEKRIQVKCVSAHSKTRRIAPINIADEVEKPFDELILLDLDKSFKPVAMYINSFEELKDRVMTTTSQTKRAVGATMKGAFGETGKKTSGSSIINWDENRVGELIGLI